MSENRGRRKRAKVTKDADAIATNVRSSNRGRGKRVTTSPSESTLNDDTPTTRDVINRRDTAALKIKQLQRRRVLEEKQREIQYEMERDLLLAELEHAELEERDSAQSTMPVRQSMQESTRSTVNMSVPSDEFRNRSARQCAGNVASVLQPVIDPVVKNTGMSNSRTDEHILNTASHVSDTRQFPASNHACPSDINQVNSDSHCTNPSVVESLQNMASAIRESFDLPKPELLTFSGNSADYCKFVRNFEANIESRVNDPRLKLSYLIQHCHGEAKRCIEDCVVLPPDEGYPRARNILLTRYGKPHLVARSHVEHLVNGPPLKPNDSRSLMDLSLDMEKCEMTLSQLGCLSDVNNTENLRRIVKRLPFNIRSQWVERASGIIESGREPVFNDVFKFVQHKALISNNLYGQDLSNESKQRHMAGRGKTEMSRSGSGAGVTTLATRVNNSPTDGPQRVLSCVYCQEKHKLRDCSKFKLTNITTKKDTVRKYNMCENCLNFKHIAKYCRKPSCCQVNGCNEKHDTMFHYEKSPRADDVSMGSCTATNVNLSDKKVCMRVVPVVVQNNSKRVQTYALLDTGSDVTLCSDSLVKELGLNGTPREYTITTVNRTSERRKGVEVSLNVEAVEGDGSITLSRVWTVERLPITLNSLPDNSDLRHWKHLAGVTLPKISEKEVGLLIGSDTPEAFWVEEERRGNHGEPYAVRSVLGWSVMGPIRVVKTASRCANVHFQQSELDDQLQRLWITDFPDIAADNKAGMSQEDRQAMKIMANTLTKENGHYKLGLPWRDLNGCLPNNKKMAETRLNQLRRKLANNPDLFEKYAQTMNSYIEQGYAKKISNTDECETGKIWYLPHHPVTNPHKPGKVRIVFDCAAKHRGESLNDRILKGPDLVNSIVGVLMRFREERVALVADIEAMFHQVNVSDKDCHALRFLWWENGNLDNSPSDYCMKVHLFGATSSPSCAAYSLKRTARDNRDQFSEGAISSVERNFYVDDLLKSVESTEQGIQLSQELRELLAMGGFRLTKWLSNSEEVMEQIPESERAIPSETVNLDDSENARLERTLGVQWNVKSDEFIFHVNKTETQHTRRGILSAASSLYDPLGFVAPVTLIPKIILQTACRQKRQWDQAIAEEETVKWQEWLDNLNDLSNVSIKRCLKPCGLDSSYTTELHMFSDASESAYGAAVYLKVYDNHGIKQFAPPPQCQLTDWRLQKE